MNGGLLNVYFFGQSDFKIINLKGLELKKLKFVQRKLGKCNKY
jgi:hypothetical protein